MDAVEGFSEGLRPLEDSVSFIVLRVPFVWEALMCEQWAFLVLVVYPLSVH